MNQGLTYTKRERSFVTWSAILGYSFDFYNLIVLAFLLVPIQKTLNVTLAQTGLIVGLTLAASVLGGILFGWVGDRIGRKNALLLRNTNPVNFFDLCAISLPLPRQSGLSAGLMLVGRNGQDRRLFSIAAAVEKWLKD